ncbi:MAG: hypothetical protein PHV34_23885 [Verrucomicrobiae bacterium]|nr:hypothetical protein [Verrucomicrobiae bacterium]
MKMCKWRLRGCFGMLMMVVFFADCAAEEAEEEEKQPEKKAGLQLDAQELYMKMDRDILVRHINDPKKAASAEKRMRQMRIKVEQLLTPGVEDKTVSSWVLRHEPEVIQMGKNLVELSKYAEMADQTQTLLARTMCDHYAGALRYLLRRDYAQARFSMRRALDKQKHLFDAIFKKNDNGQG